MEVKLFPLAQLVVGKQPTESNPEILCWSLDTPECWLLKIAHSRKAALSTVEWFGVEKGGEQDELCEECFHCHEPNNQIRTVVLKVWTPNHE